MYRATVCLSRWCSGDTESNTSLGRAATLAGRLLCSGCAGHWRAVVPARLCGACRRFSGLRRPSAALGRRLQEHLYVSVCICNPYLYASVTCSVCRHSSFATAACTDIIDLCCSHYCAAVTCCCGACDCLSTPQCLFCQRPQRKFVQQTCKARVLEAPLGSPSQELCLPRWWLQPHPPPREPPGHQTACGCPLSACFWGFAPPLRRCRQLLAGGLHIQCQTM